MKKSLDEKDGLQTDSVQRWRIRDIIDLEYFFYQDASYQSAEDQQHLHERDRNFFINTVRPRLKEGSKRERLFLIREWLNRRRAGETAGDAVLPGEAFESLYSSFRILFVLAGLLFGGGAGLSFLTYTGDRPLNVFVYLAVFVLSQLLLFLMLFVLLLYKRRKRSFLSSSPLYRVIGKSMLRIVLWAGSRIGAKIGADRRSRVESIQAVIVNKGRTYGFLFVLPIFILTQLFAIGFNLGLLATTLFKVITADIAFGWQSTLQLSSAAVYWLVQKIALPWSWLVKSDIAIPSLAQIEGSRIILKEGIYHLSTPDLASWWPFLCFSVVFYGLLPRFFLFLGGAAVQRFLLGALNFRHGACEQLLLRMKTPLVTTRGRKVEDAVSDLMEPQPAYAGRDQSAAEAAGGKGKNLLVMIPDDIFASGSMAEIETAVQNRFGAETLKFIRINEDSETDAEMLAGLQNRSEANAADILLIQEAWQPPILEYTNFIRNLRQAIGPKPCIRIGLIGKPLEGEIFTPVLDENRKIWTRKINAIGDPCIYVVGMVNNAN